MDKATEDKIIAHYQKGQGSIQDIARVYNVSVAEVLRVTGQGHLATVQTQGDMISAADAGPGAQMNYGKEFSVPFTTD
jgi:hypothetical protein